jgi:hypothetical protein
MIAVELPGWRGDGEDRRGASSTDVTRGPEPATKRAEMHRLRERSTFSFEDPYLVAPVGLVDGERLESGGDFD